MTDNIYETQRLVDEYLLFHYADAKDQISWSDGSPASSTGFPVRVAEHLGEELVERTLDIGAAVGRSSYVLSRYANEVVSIDYSAAFIAAAERLRDEGQLTISRLVEGNLRDSLRVQKPEDANAERIQFQVGDAMNLSEELGTFDRVLAANLLCRLPDPTVFLSRLPSLVRSGGLVVLATPCTWLEEFTPPGNWPKGTTLQFLKDELVEKFDFVEETNEPFLIRETARKFQWTVSLVTKWRKK